MDPSPLGELGEYVRRRRGYLGLNQVEVAQALGQDQSSWVSKLENGKHRHMPDQDTLTKLAQVLQCTNADLLRAAGYLPPEPAENEHALARLVTNRADVRDAVHRAPDLPVHVRRIIDEALAWVDEMEREQEQD